MFYKGRMVLDDPNRSSVEMRFGLRRVFGPTPLPLWQKAVWFFAAYFVCAELSNRLSLQSNPFETFWLPAGLYLAVLLLNERRNWPWLVLAAFPANLLFDLLHRTRPVLILVFFGINSLQAVLGAWLVQRFVTRRSPLATLSEFIGLLGFSAVLSAMLVAAIGSAVLVAARLGRPFMESWKVWWGSNAMAILLLTPFILAWFSRAGRTRRDFRSPKKIVEAALLFPGLGVYVWYLLVWDQGVMSVNRIWAILFLLWAGLRFGVRGATAASLLLSLSLTFFPAHFFRGLTPGQIQSGEYVFVMQMALAMGTLVALIPAVVLGERDRSLTRLGESEERFRHLTQAAFEGITISEQGRILDMNDQGLKMFGYGRDEMVGKAIVDLVAPESQALVEEAVRTGREVVYEHRLLRKDGSLFYAEAQAKMVRVGKRTLRMTALRDITERKQAEQALRESEEKYAKAFRNSPDAVTITRMADGQIIEANEGFRRIFGHAPAEAVGRTTLELRVWGNPGDRDRALRELQQAGFVRDWELPFRTREGKPGVGLFSAEKIEIRGEPCLVTVVRDITERKQAEAALRASEESLRATIEYTPYVAVQWFDARGGITFWNLASETIYGWTAAEAMGKTLGQLILAPAEQAVFEKALKQIALDGKPIGPMEFPFRHRSGSGGVVLSTIFRIPAPDAEPRFVCMDVDMSERKRAELARADAVLREQQARAEYTLQLIASQEAERTRIAAELHDSLGQNLLLIKNRAQLALAGKKLPADWRGQFENISQLASRSIDEARQISHDLHPHQLDHLGLTSALEAMLDSAAASSAIVFERKLDNVDGLFSKDAAMNLYRVVQESLNNILKHSRARQAGIRLERDVHEVQLNITDDGCGYPAGGPANGGKGLGLKNIAERVRILGGKLKIDSSPGKGTRLEVIIPMASDE